MLANYLHTNSISDFVQDAVKLTDNDLCFAKILHASGINRLINRPPFEPSGKILL